MLRHQKSFLSLLLAGVLIAHSSNVFAAMSSTNYQINWDELSGGGGVGSSVSYQIRDSAGGSGESSRASSTNYGIDQGFRAGIYDPVVDFVPYVQDRSTQVATTSFSSNIVTVTTTSGFAVGDWIAIIQDEGSSQISAMAYVTAKTGTTMTVNANYSGTTPSINGSNDYVYRMSSTASPSLGTLSTTAVSTSMIGWVSTADVTQGFSMYMFSNGNLTDGPDTIAAVSDGSVTAGTSEYGGRSSDTTLATSTFDTQDTAFTTDPSLVGSISTNVMQSSGFVTLKTAISTSQVAGSYSQTLTAIFVGDY